MIDGLLVLLGAIGAFVGSHLLLSHPLRARLVRAFGEAGFQLVYSALTIGLLLLTLLAWHQAPHGPNLWSSDNLALQIVFSITSLFATALLLASLIDNPGLVGANVTGLSTRPPTGVFRITRHPMMFGIAIWSLAQVLIDATPRNMIVFGGLIVLAVVGSHLQDGKKTALSGREWALWVYRTPFWPNLRRISQLGLVLPLALLPWMLLVWIEVRATNVPLGLWYFLPNLGY